MKRALLSDGSIIRYPAALRLEAARALVRDFRLRIIVNRAPFTAAKSHLISAAEGGEPATGYHTATSIDGVITHYHGVAADRVDLAHAFGHLIALSLWEDFDPPPESPYGLIVAGEEAPPSEPAMVSPAEDFADSVRLFLTDPLTLEAVAPLRYEEIDRLTT